MSHLKLDLRTIDVGAPCESPSAFAARIIALVQSSWQQGSDIVLLPEFAWLGLERFIEGPDPLRRVAELFWNSLWPMIRSDLQHPNRSAVLGTVPFIDTDGRLLNRSPILRCGSELYQDKLHLTPWEDAFSAGQGIHLWNHNGIRIAVIICMDIEIPEISAALRGQDVDLILVPSATESLLGVERVGRCASARAVELGCHVAVSHLVGQMESVLIDENIGRLAVYHPSQSPFSNADRSHESEIHQAGFQRMSVDLDFSILRSLRNGVGETNPSQVRPHPISIIPS